MPCSLGSLRILQSEPSFHMTRCHPCTPTWPEVYVQVSQAAPGGKAVCGSRQSRTTLPHVSQDILFREEGQFHISSQEHQVQTDNITIEYQDPCQSNEAVTGQKYPGGPWTQMPGRLYGAIVSPSLVHALGVLSPPRGSNCASLPPDLTIQPFPTLLGEGTPSRNQTKASGAPV